MASAAFEIRTVGEIPAEVFEDFEGVSVSVDPAGTTIHATLADEAELSGLLEAINREGYVIVDLRREAVGDVGADPVPPASTTP
jgi:hypothetical protein